MPLFKSKKKAKATAAATDAPAAKTEKLPAKQPRMNDLEADFVGTYYIGKSLQASHRRELLFGALALLFAILYFAFPRTVYKNHYFVTNPNGTVMPLVAFNHPFDSDSAVIHWTENAVTGALNFDALDYRRRMQSNAKYFTKTGYTTFLHQFRKNGLYADMMARKLMISAVQSGPAIIRLKGLNPQGIYSWQIQIPLHFRLENSNGFSSKRYLATVLVQRTANWENPQAIAIQALSLQEE
jgi:hypothetical protein